MFKKFLDTSIHLARISIDVVSKIVNPNDEQPQVDESPHPEPDERKTTVSGLKENLLRQATFKHEKILLEAAPRRTMVYKVRVPDLKFTAAGSNKTVELRKIRQPAVLFISHRENSRLAAELNWELVRPYLGSAIPFFTANIILLNEFPGFMHPMVRREMRKSYNDITRDYIKDRRLAEQVVHLLPDWKAESLAAFHIAQHRPMLASIILSPAGNVQHVIQSAAPLEIIRQELSAFM